MPENVIDISVPWGAWYQDVQHRLQLPGHWTVDVLGPRDGSACSNEDVENALRNPIGCPPLEELAQGKQTACIVVDDLARPTRADKILPTMLEQIHSAGIPESGTKIVLATGSHGAVEQQGIAFKVGKEIAARYEVECHDCRGDLVSTGIEYGDNELRINRTFYEAELKLAIGSILPHSFAGYSGGAKLVLPGLTDLQATARSHKFVQLGLRGGSDPDRNKFRSEAERLARQLGLEFIVCVISNQRREPTAVFAGDLVAAHRAGCAEARNVFATDLERDYDCLILNAYPKDNDLIQAENVFIALKKAKSPALRDDGVIVLTTAASEGVGRHGLFEPGGLSHRPPQRKRPLGNRELWIYAPSVSPQEAHQLYWNGYPVIRQTTELTTALHQRFPSDARAAVFPCAPMQEVVDLRTSAREMAV